MEMKKMKNLVVCFPGIGYHSDKPLLYFARKLAKEIGYDDYVEVSYSYEKAGLQKNKELMTEAIDSLYKIAEDTLDKVDFHQYEKILFISKSVGTAVACKYASEHKISCKQVLFTPLEETFQYIKEQKSYENPYISFTGTNDPWVDEEILEFLSKERKILLYKYDGANHSLETPNTLMNLEILTEVMTKTKEFIYPTKNITW